MDVSSRVPVKLATGDIVDSLDSLRLVALSSGIGLEPDTRSQKVLVMDFSSSAVSGKLHYKTSLLSNDRTFGGLQKKEQTKNPNFTPLPFSSAFSSSSSSSSFGFNGSNLSNISNVSNVSNLKGSFKSDGAKKFFHPSWNLKNDFSFFKKAFSFLSRRKNLGLKTQSIPDRSQKLSLFTRVKRIVAHSIDICIVFNFSLLVIFLLSMLIWRVSPSDMISSPIVGFILQMRGIEFIFWLYVLYFLYRYFLRSWIGTTLGLRLCFGRKTKSSQSKV